MGWQAMRRTLAQPAYRNLYLTTLIFISVISFGLHQFLVYGLDQSFNLTNWTLGIMIGVIYGVVYGMLYGVVIGVLGGVTLSMTLGLMLSVTEEAMLSVILGLIVGMVLGMTYSVSYGMGLGVTVGTALGGLVGVGLDTVVLNLALAMIVSVTIGVAIGVIITALPLPYTLGSVKRQITQGSHDLFTLPVQNLFANLFQRWMLQRVYSDWLKNNPQALVWFYALIHDPRGMEAVRPPIQLREFNRLPTVCLLLLGEIGQTFVGGEGIGRIAWYLTYPLRLTQPTPISRFSLLLYELLRDEEEIDTMPVAELHGYLLVRAGLYSDYPTFVNYLFGYDTQARDLLMKSASDYDGLADMVHGAEVAQSFRLITFGLGMESVDDIINMTQRIHRLNPSGHTINALSFDPKGSDGEPFGSTPLRPTVMATLDGLADIQRELAAYQAATSLGQKNIALNGAASLLKELADYVQAQVLPPEQSLLLRLISHWRDVVAVEQGQWREQALPHLGPLVRRHHLSQREASMWARPSEPISNPYIAGTPVYPPLFRGRQDIFNQIASIWQDKAVPDSIILYGHRRMGKTSILRNLSQAVSGLIIYVDLQGEASFVASTAELLLNLAYALRDGVNLAYPLPTTCESTNEAKIHFREVLKQIPTRPIFLALDEFEAIDLAVSEGKISPDIYPFLRSLAMSADLTLILGGSHQLSEMSHDYQQAFFKSYQEVTVSFLDHATAWQLITNPTDDFGLNYEAAAVEQIIAVTGGQPYLMQQVCRNALDNLNHEWFDLHQEREIMIQLSDVNAVLGEVILRDGFGYFDGVWRQSHDPLQHELLRWIAAQPTPCAWADIQAAFNIDEAMLRNLLDWAVRHDILLEVAPMQWAYRVPLMREWVAGSDE